MPESPSKDAVLVLSPEAQMVLDEILRLGPADSTEEAVRQAIHNKLLLMKARMAGWRVVVQKNNTLRDVIYPEPVPRTV